MKVSLVILLAALGEVAAGGEVSRGDNEKRELSGHGKHYYPVHSPTKHHPYYKTPYPTHKPPTPYPTGAKPTKPYYPAPNPYPKPVKPPPVKTSRPTTVPTPNPTPDPTPLPTTLKPTPYPTFGVPSAAPSTLEPSAEPTPSPTFVPSPMPSDAPSTTPSTAEPSLEPSSSEEPSSNPTLSEEPSESPTTSEEPSDVPSVSLEPSVSFEPTVEPTSVPTDEFVDPTLFDTICDDDVDQIFGLLCSFIQLFPDIAVLLGAVEDPAVDPAAIMTRVDSLIHSAGRRKLDEPGVGGGLISSVIGSEKGKPEPTPAVFGSTFSLSGISRGEGTAAALIQEGAQDLTLFAPTNYAFITMPAGLLAAIVGPDGQDVLEDLLLYHVFEGKLKFNRLFCGKERQMANGEITTTRCRNGFKFQVGEGNERDREPEIVFPDGEATNGIIHVVDEVILPGMSTPSPSTSSYPSGSSYPTESPL